MLEKITNRLFLISIALLIFIIGFKLGQISSSKSTKSSLLNIVTNNSYSNPYEVDFKLFWDVWEKLDDKFVDKSKLITKNMYYGAIKGMVSSLGDPYTFFLSPEENKQSKDDLGGKLEGIGAQLGMDEKRIIIVAPLKNSPAEKAGLKSCDVISKVDGQLTTDWTLQQAVNKIRGQKGTTVKLTLSRCQKDYEAIIIRQAIQVNSIEYEIKNRIAYLKLIRFGDDTEEEWDKTINSVARSWKNNQIDGLVLDLRDNPGGYLEGAIYVASEFIPKGSLVVKQEYSDNKSHDYLSKKPPRLLNIPLIILINRGSASASEIVAGALRDYKKAQIVGVNSFGKGSIQEAIDLDDNAGLHITIAKWILPNGDWINGKGIKPDINIKDSSSYGCDCSDDNLDSKINQDDNQLEKALELLSN